MTGTAGETPGDWWWCFEHQRAENPPDSAGHRRLGPYETRTLAEHWREKLDERNQAWDDEDERWSGKRPS